VLRLAPHHGGGFSRGVRSSRVMKTIDRTLRLTWRKALLMATFYVALLGAHFLVEGSFHAKEPVLLLAATLVVPMWAISAAVYTLDDVMLSPGLRWWHRS
jgi:hypothetical protein